MEYYKYLPPARADVLEKLKIRYTQACVLNDPFESLPGILQKDRDWYKKVFQSLISKEADEYHFRNEVKRKQYIRERKKDFNAFYNLHKDEDRLFKQAQSIALMDSVIQGYLSMSATNKNTLMWSHYAKNHEGFIIGFSANHSYFHFGITQVQYDDERPYLDTSKSKQDGRVFYTKSKDWAYEEEYRKSMGFVEPIILENGNSLLPYPDEVPDPKDKELSKIRLFDFPKESVSSITFGWRAKPELKSQLISALNMHKMTDVKVFEATPHKVKYAMEINEIKNT